MPRMRLGCTALVFLSVPLFTSGCGTGSIATATANNQTLSAIVGHVHGGQQPVSGATIQLYAANANTAKGASTALISSPVHTDVNGQFSITNAYSCSPGNLVYIVASQGNPGLTGGGSNNPNLVLMAALGTCGSLTSSTSISINELTTVASVVSLAPFMADVSHIGTDASNAGGLAGAFAGAQALVDFSTGAPTTSGSGLAAPAANLNTLADILAACVNSPGGTAGDGSNCGKLFQYASVTGSTTTDTVAAMLRIALAPAHNVAQLYNLATSDAPFQPTLSTAPGSFILPQTVGLERDPALLTIDTKQHVWVDTATSTATNPQTGPILVYDTGGNLLFRITAGTGGLYAPIQMLVDPQGNTWTLNGNYTLSKFDPNGNPLSPAGGFPLPLGPAQPPPAFFFLQQATGGVPVGGSYAAFDPNGNLWGLGSGSTSNCLIEVNNSGTVITPSGTFCSSARNSLTIAVAADGSGNIWVTGSSSVSKSSAVENFLTSGVNSGGCFALDASNPTRAGIVTDTLGMLYDRMHDQLWGIGSENLGLLRSDGSQIFCKTGPSNLPIVSFSAFQNTSCQCTTYSGVFLTGPALDGAGTLWFLSEGSNVTPPSASNVINYAALNAVDYRGNLLEPYDANAGVLGLSDAPFTIASQGKSVTEYLIGGAAMSAGLAVDAYGNLWMAGLTQLPGSNVPVLVKVPGLAAPKLTQ